MQEWQWTNYMGVIHSSGTPTGPIHWEVIMFWAEYWTYGHLKAKHFHLNFLWEVVALRWYREIPSLRPFFGPYFFGGCSIEGGTLPKTNITPENGWLGMLVSFWEGLFQGLVLMENPAPPGINKSPVSGINYQPHLVRRISEPSTAMFVSGRLSLDGSFLKWWVSPTTHGLKPTNFWSALGVWKWGGKTTILVKPPDIRKKNTKSSWYSSQDT